MKAVKHGPVAQGEKMKEIAKEALPDREAPEAMSAISPEILLKLQGEANELLTQLQQTLLLENQVAKITPPGPPESAVEEPRLDSTPIPEAHVPLPLPPMPLPRPEGLSGKFPVTRKRAHDVAHETVQTFTQPLREVIGGLQEELCALRREVSHALERQLTGVKKEIVALHNRLVHQKNAQFELQQEDAVLHRYFVSQFAVTARLVGACNELVGRQLELEQRLSHQSIDLSNRVGVMLEKWQALGLGSASERVEALEALGEIQRSEVEAASRVNAELIELRERMSALSTEMPRQAHALTLRVTGLEQQERETAERTERLLKLLGKIDERLSAMRPAEALQTPKLYVQPETAISGSAPEFDFLQFEALTRGSEVAISSEQQKYLRFFEGQSNVLDAGCGRGEFLEILRSAGISAYGVDADERMVEHCRAKGLHAELADVFEHLGGVPDKSLGGIFLGQVVEHLPFEVLAALPHLAFQKLRAGACIVMETINPTCLTTFSGAFYADPTHVKPLHPKALEYFLRSAHFDDIEVIFSAPVPESQRLQPVHEDAPIDPALKTLLLQMNQNIARLNSVLFSYGDYAIAGRKPA